MAKKKEVPFSKKIELMLEAELCALRELGDDLSELHIHPSCVHMIWMRFKENHFVSVAWETDNSSRIFRTKRTANYHLFLEGLYVIPRLTAVLQKPLTKESAEMIDYYTGTVIHELNQFRECLKQQGVMRPNALLVWLAREKYQSRVHRKIASPCVCAKRKDESSCKTKCDVVFCYETVSGKLPNSPIKDR